MPGWRRESIAPGGGCGMMVPFARCRREGRMRYPLAAAVLLLMSVQTQVQAQGSSVCIYSSQSFSEGASICVARHLMMSCSVTESRAVWKLVGDRGVSRMCPGPSRSAVETAVPPRRQLARRGAAAVPPADTGTKCFTFNGRRFCE
jgi:hypothetical protein